MLQLVVLVASTGFYISGDATNESFLMIMVRGNLRTYYLSSGAEFMILQLLVQLHIQQVNCY